MGSSAKQDLLSSPINLKIMKPLQLLKHLLSFVECEFLDYKQEYPSTNSDLVHDILCLSNSLTDSDRYLIFGVNDQKKICGVESDKKRKKQADIITILRTSRLNRIPKLSLVTASKNGHKIDILTIKNAAEKPYFLTTDYIENGRPLRAGVIYSRIKDTNTPVNESSQDHIVEKMFYERIGLNLTPRERFFKYLREMDKWRKDHDEEGRLFYYHEQFPEFTLIEKKEDSPQSYTEPWSIDFPDSNSTSIELFAKYHGTILDKLILVWLDGYRYMRIQPEIKVIQNSETFHYCYYYVKDSLKQIANTMILTIDPDSRDLAEHLFPTFGSKEEANRILDEDFNKPVKEFRWYYLDTSQREYFRIDGDKKYKIFRSH